MDSESQTPTLFSHSISGTTPHSGARSSLSREATTSLTSPLSHVSSNAKRFVRPDGRTVHVARSPDEEMRLRRRLTSYGTWRRQIEEKDAESAVGEGNWDIVIHGSEQHVSRHCEPVSEF